MQALQDGNKNKVLERAKEICPDGYFGAIADLSIAWVREGELFEITEYDGAESVNVISEQSYLQA